MRTSILAAVAFSGGVTACTTNVTFDDGIAASVAVGLDDDFRTAAANHGVPTDLLAAVSFAETRWQNVASEGHDSPSAHGVMALGGDRLARAATLARHAEDEARTDIFANIDAAAALLADAGRSTGATPNDLASWRDAVAEVSWIADEEARESYVDTVYAVLAGGAAAYAESGELIAKIPAHPELEGTSFAPDPHVAGPDYAPAQWRPSPNFSSRPSGARVSMIIIHTCEGAYAGCWGWLKNTSSGVSAHYVVKEDGSEITQLVREGSKAWHISATYDCSRNGNTDCAKNGQGSNNFTVGIEHGGFESQTAFPRGQIEASAKLVCDIARDNNVPVDRNHIVGHGQLQPWNRSDPGANWPWADYMDRIRTACDGGGPGPTDPPPTDGGPVNIVVDSNNANNDSAVAQVTVGASWTSASSTAGYYGSGYWFGDTGATDDAVAFKFFLPAGGTHTIEAWWTAGTNRSSTAQFVAFNASGAEVGRTTVSQQSQGSQWVSLGSATFSAGWNRVELRRRGTSGKVVIADAVRIR
jgi:N-acetyl-anhydromuramyl-L-alanine amidase AmpD